MCVKESDGNHLFRLNLFARSWCGAAAAPVRVVDRRFPGSPAPIALLVALRADAREHGFELHVASGRDVLDGGPYRQVGLDARIRQR